MSAGIPNERLAHALQTIAAWRSDPETARVCPVCAAEGLEIIDRSTRPYSEWYALNCAACGLAAVVHIPLAGPAAH